MSTSVNKTGSFYSKAFKQGMASLMDEIQLALHWSRPSILVAVHKGSTGQAKARAQLKKDIEAGGVKVRTMGVDKGNLNVVQSILKNPDRANSVFFITGIEKNGETERHTIYRALNFQRELLVENRIVLVLWLAMREAAELPAYAPDFWAFRHRVVEFAPDRTSHKSIS
jgi:uncharacterized protein with GYD domain